MLKITTVSKLLCSFGLSVVVLTLLSPVVLAQTAVRPPITPSRLQYTGPETACVDAIAHFRHVRQLKYDSETFDGTTSVMPVAQFDAILSEEETANASITPTTVGACQPGAGQDAFWEQQWLIDRENGFFLVSHELPDNSKLDLGQLTGDLTRMKGEGFAKRHPAIYADWLEELHKEYDSLNGTFRAPI